MSWATILPKDLTVKPLPLVVLTGLDIKHNAVHKEIWDGFNLRTNLKFRYKLLDGDHEYPKCKNKRPPEYHIPKGILKTNWLNKHLYQVPSLVVIFFDLDWDEPNWKEKQMECATKTELVRNSLVDRNTRVILILVQKHPSIPIDGDNLLARERYPALCAACAIKTNYLFLLHSEHLHGYIIKLEDDAFNEPAQTYYTLEIKAIKLKRDSLIKVTHQFLFVRLAIKIAFFNEMKQDIFKAIEYYKQAYLNVLDIRFYDTNILEIKTVAGIINYKLCQLFFEIKHPIDAIDQFRKHIDIFRIKVGSAELKFEHSAWLAKQFELMGELFEDAINKNHLTPVQTQHPGFYFHSAANHTIQRRAYCKESLTKSVNNSKQWNNENPSPIESLNYLEFYGQRPWRQGQQGMEILDQQKERDGILCLQEMEASENLTPLITDLFKQAISHFKVFNCKRMKQYLSVCMAEEFYFAKSYQESLNIYVKVLNDYNNEHWWPILTSIMSNALKCAYLVGDITNYCLLCTEIIGINILLSQNEKSLIQSNLIKVIQNEIPSAEYHQIDNSTHLISEANSKWESELNKSLASNDMLTSQNIDASVIIAAHKLIPAHVSGMVPFVECKVQFKSLLFNSNQQISLNLYVRTNCPDPIQFSKLYIRFNMANYNQYCVIESSKINDETNKLYFVPNKIYEFNFKFLPHQQDIGKDLEVNSISLELGNREKRVLVMHWKGDCKNALTQENHTVVSFLKTKSAKEVIILEETPVIDWNLIKVAPIASIIARKANLEIKLEHKMPIFVDELYAIKLTIENKEENSIENLSLIAEFQNNTNTANDFEVMSNGKLGLWIGSIEDKNSYKTQQTKHLKNIESFNNLTEYIYVQLKEIKSVNLIIKVNYNNERKISNASAVDDIEAESNKVKQSIKCTCIQEDQLKLESINPFKFEFSLLSMQMKPINSVHFNEPFLLLCDVKNETPYSLKFKNSFLKTNKMVKFKADNGQEEVQSFLKGEVLKPNETATECYYLTIDKSENYDETITKPSLVNLGEYFVEWRRKKILDDSNEEDEDDEIDESDLNEDIQNNEDLFSVKSKINLPEITAEPFPFLIEAIIPTYGCLNELMSITYRIRNLTLTKVLDIECVLDENEFFSISGKKLEMMQIMSNDTKDYTYLVYPLQAGYCKLPNFHIKLNNYNSNPAKPSIPVESTKQPLGIQDTSSLSQTELTEKELDTIIQNMLPSQIFIFPEKKEDQSA